MAPSCLQFMSSCQPSEAKPTSDDVYIRFCCHCC